MTSNERTRCVLGDDGPETAVAWMSSLDESAVNLAVVSFDRPASDWLSTPALPADQTVITAGETMRSTAAASAAADAAGASVVPVDDVDDLAEVCQAVRDHLDATTPGVTPVVFVDAASVLLSSVPLERAFRFLHLVTATVGAAGGAVCVHIDPTPADEDSVRVLEPLFHRVATA